MLAGMSRAIASSASAGYIQEVRNEMRRLGQNNTMPSPTYTADRSERIVKAAFARLDLTALAIAIGCLCALVLSAATVFLLIKGAPPGGHIGPHLGLLSNFLPAYSVSWSGSVIGFVYGFVIGFVVGAIIAAAWNLSHHIYLMLVARRDYVARDL